MRVNASSSWQPGDITGILARIGGAVVGGVTNAGQAGLTMEQSLTPVDTGALLASETLEITQPTDTSVQAEFGPHIFYSVYVEFGTGKRGAESADRGPGPYSSTWPGQTPQPYCRPTLDWLANGAALDAVSDAVAGVL